MLDFYRKYCGGQYSQNGEANIIDECIQRIGLRSGTAIEFGAPTKKYCSNIYHLIDWERLYYDENPQEDGITKMTVTMDNINSLPPCQIISMDTDGWDYLLFMAYNGKPDIVIVEINSSFAPTIEHFTTKEGASYRTMCKLAISKGYFVLCHTGNIIAVRNEHKRLFPEITSDPIEDYSLYFNTSWLC